MLNVIVPPPIELASVIAWRNEPVPVSLVFVTVKTKGVVTLFGRGIPSTVERSPGRLLNASAKLDTSKTEQADNSATATAIRSAEARIVLFCFFFMGGDWGLTRRYILFYGKSRPKFPEASTKAAGASCQIRSIL
jgi:hypothetical protein